MDQAKHRGRSSSLVAHLLAGLWTVSNQNFSAWRENYVLKSSGALLSKYRVLKADGTYERDADGVIVQIAVTEARIRVNGPEAKYVFCKNQSVIQPKPGEPKVYPSNGASASPGPRLIERYLTADPAARAAIDEGWDRGRMKVQKI